MKKLLILAAGLFTCHAVSAQTPLQEARAFIDTYIRPNGLRQITGAIHHTADSLLLAAIEAATGTGSGPSDGNNYPTGLSFNTTTGQLAMSRAGLATIGANLDGRYLLQSSPAGQLGSTDITNFNVAYQWGNHALAGYLTSGSALSASNLTSGTIPAARFGTGTVAPGALSGSGATMGQVLKYNGSVWAPATPVAPSLDQVLSAGATSDETIQLQSYPSSTAIEPGNLAVSDNDHYCALNASVGLVLKTKSGGGSGFSTQTKSDNVTGARLYQNPDRSGTYALQGDTILPNFIARAGATTGQALVWNGSAYAPATVASGGGGISGSGTANTLAKWTAAGAIGNSRVTDDGTTIGLDGNTSVSGSLTMGPGGTLFTNRFLGISPAGGINPTGYTPLLVTNPSYPSYGSFGYFDGGAGAFIVNNGDPGHAIFSAMLNGRVGIGTLYPQAALEVSGSAIIYGYLDLPDLGYDPPAPSSGIRLYNNGNVFKIIKAGESSGSVIH